jgi:hypothetical protein
MVFCVILSVVWVLGIGVGASIATVPVALELTVASCARDTCRSATKHSMDAKDIASKSLSSSLRPYSEGLIVINDSNAANVGVVACLCTQ